LPASLWAALLPAIAAAIYYAFFAAPIYVSEARFIVNSASKSRNESLGFLASFLQSTGISRSRDNNAVVQDFMTSRDALRRLGDDLDLQHVYGGPAADLVARFPGPFSGATFEELYVYYQGRVHVVTKASSGITTLRVEAFRPEDSRRIATLLLAYGEELVNAMNVRALADTLAMAEREVAHAEARLLGVQRDITIFRTEQATIDPGRASMAMMELVAQLAALAATSHAELETMQRTSPGSPAIPAMRARIAALERQVAEERARMTDKVGSVVPQMATYEQLVLARELAARSLALATASLEAARVEAHQKQLYLERIVAPNLPDYPLLPRRVAMPLIILVVCVGLYGLAWLVMAGAREHAGA
jgi:capsular polysaccharide transport system permease protein